MLEKEVRTLAMGAMNAEALATRARATQAVFMVEGLGITKRDRVGEGKLRSRLR